MPWRDFTKIVKGEKKFCMTTISTGKTYCYKSKADREKGKKMHKMFEHINK